MWRLPRDVRHLLREMLWHLQNLGYVTLLKKWLFLVSFDEKCLFSTSEKDYFFEKLDRRSWESSSKKVGLHNTMQFHLFFRTVKTIGLHLISIKRYSKNAHPSYFLKWIIVLGLDYLYNKSWREGLRVLQTRLCFIK